MSGRAGALALIALGAMAVAGNAVDQSSAAFTAKKSNAATFTTKSDWLAPVVTLTAPAASALTTDTTPTLSGAAGALTGDGTTITVRVYAGSTTAGALVQTLTATRTGTTFTIDATALADGTYTAQASQSDAAGNTGTSTARTFTVDTTKPAGVAVQAVNGSGVAGRPDSGDVVTFSFSEPVTAASILAGWDGTPRAIQARFTNATGTGLDTFHIRESGSSTSVKLDASVATYANVVTATVDFPATMVRAADGRSVSVTFGAASAPGSVVAGPSGLLNMRWTLTTGPLDLAGNAITVATIAETDTDRDF